VGAPFSHRLRVAFDDVDHAGIVYYPRFFHYFHLAFEELLFTQLAAVGGYSALLNERKLGLPAVHAEADYKAPLRFGDVCRIDVRATEVGAKSITLGYTVHAPDGRVACEGKVTAACVDLTRFRAVPLPDDLRAIFAALA
jgi:4-hydroxybenzoyl-CoA thioesterase